MTPTEKQQAIATAMRYTGDKEEAQAKGERAEIYLIKDTTSEELTKVLFDSMKDLDASHDLSYEIASRACDIVADIDLDKDTDDQLADQTPASVYIATRLSYLNAHNQDTITDISKEYDCDIQEACAYWYDNQVRDVARALLAWVVEDNA